MALWLFLSFHHILQMGLHVISRGSIFRKVEANTEIYLKLWSEFYIFLKNSKRKQLNSQYFFVLSSTNLVIKNSVVVLFFKQCIVYLNQLKNYTAPFHGKHPLTRKYRALVIKGE